MGVFMGPTVHIYAPDQTARASGSEILLFESTFGWLACGLVVAMMVNDEIET